MRRPSVLQVVACVGVETVTARNDLAERVVTGAGVVPRCASALGGTQLLGGIGREQRFLYPPMRRAKSRVARRRGDAQPVHSGTRACRDEPADDDVLLEAHERIDLAL